MSGKVYGEAFCTVPRRVVFSKVSINAKLLYAILACYADNDGHCYPGRKTLSDAMGVSEETVKRAKKELADAELIACHPRSGLDGRRTTDDIVLLPMVVLSMGHGCAIPPDLHPPRVTGDPYPRVTGDPTRTNAIKELSTTTRPGVKNDPPEASQTLYKANGSTKLTDEDRQRGLERLRQLREGH